MFSSMRADVIKAIQIAWVLKAPLSDTLDMRITFEVIEVFGFLPPALLSVDFTGLAAGGLGTVALTRHVTVVGIEKRFAVRTLTLAGWICHGPDSP
jgi:hypothetical protein